jgi:anti-sigma factor RsiW
MNHVCDQLDAYLLDLLEPADRAAFVAHARDCAVCTRELELQRRIDGLLARAEEAEVAPPLRMRFNRQLRARRLRRWVGVGAVAAGLLSVAVWRLAPRTLPPSTSIANRATPAAPANLERPIVSVRLSGNVIALPVETSDPRVTIVWTYPVRPLATTN